MPHELTPDLTPVISLHPTQGEPMALPCPSCGERTLAMLGVTLQPFEAEPRTFLLLGGEEMPHSPPSPLVPAIAISCYCVGCRAWSYVGVHTYPDGPGVWLLFDEATRREPAS